MKVRIFAYIYMYIVPILLIIFSLLFGIYNIAALFVLAILYVVGIFLFLSCPVCGHIIIIKTGKYSKNLSAREFFSSSVSKKCTNCGKDLVSVSVRPCKRVREFFSRSQ